jgi:hypothetical protein
MLLVYEARMCTDMPEWRNADRQGEEVSDPSRVLDPS